MVPTFSSFLPSLASSTTKVTTALEPHGLQLFAKPRFRDKIKTAALHEKTFIFCPVISF
jgi:hypothetical protein